MGETIQGRILYKEIQCIYHIGSEFASKFISRHYSSTIWINSGLPLVSKEATDFNGPKIAKILLYYQINTDRQSKRPN